METFSPLELADKKALVFFCHLEECLDTGLDLAGISLRVVGLDLEKGHVPVLCEVLLEDAGFDIVGVASNPGDIDDTVSVVLFCEF